MQHRSNNRYGENIYACFGKTGVTGAEVVQSWYSEIKDYRFGESNPRNFGQVGHFTQVVWKNSKHLGVGIAKNGWVDELLTFYWMAYNDGKMYFSGTTFMLFAIMIHLETLADSILQM